MCLAFPYLDSLDSLGFSLHLITHFLSQSIKLFSILSAGMRSWWNAGTVNQRKDPLFTTWVKSWRACCLESTKRFVFFLHTFLEGVVTVVQPSEPLDWHILTCTNYMNQAGALHVLGTRSWGYQKKQFYSFRWEVEKQNSLFPMKSYWLKVFSGGFFFTYFHGIFQVVKVFQKRNYLAHMYNLTLSLFGPCHFSPPSFPLNLLTPL